jgi:hypothetical protein
MEGFDAYSSKVTMGIYLFFGRRFLVFLPPDLGDPFFLSSIKLRPVSDNSLGSIGGNPFGLSLDFNLDLDLDIGSVFILLCESSG